MQQHWIQLWQRLKAPPPQGVWAQLASLYNSPDRHYHNLTHIQECLNMLALLPTQPQSSASETIELAIWFHDAIYDTRATDNEQRSADFARSTIQQAGLGTALAAQVYQLVLATGHQSSVMADRDTQILLDIDLAILGSEPNIFWAYEAHIRQEYAWVPLATFRQKRAEILQTFLEREIIYQNAFYRKMLEATARRNLADSIAQLANK
jgi:predicted metal-dependent HD superfamily phosphohydrolase